MIKPIVILFILLQVCSCATFSDQTSDDREILMVSNSYDKTFTINPMSSDDWMQVFQKSENSADKLQALLGTGRYQKAIALSKSLLTKKPLYRPAIKALMFAWAMQKNFPMSLYYARIFEKNYGKDADTINIRGLNYLFGYVGKSQDLVNAEITFRKALKLQSQHVASALNLGYVQMKLEHYDDARQTFRFLRDKNPQNAEVNFAYGLSMLYSGFPEMAGNIFKEALKFNQHHVPSLMQLALIELKTHKNTENSIAYLNKIVSSQGQGKNGPYDGYARQMLRTLRGRYDSH